MLVYQRVHGGLSIAMVHCQRYVYDKSLEPPVSIQLAACPASNDAKWPTYCLSWETSSEDPEQRR